MARNRHIRPGHVKSIVQLIREWPNETINWEAVCTSAFTVLGYKPTRGGLSSHDEIQKAFAARKAGLAVSPPTRAAQPSSLAVAGRSISTLKAEIVELKRDNDNLSDRLMIWLYNARALGMTEKQLNEPLPHIDRGRSV